MGGAFIRLQHAVKFRYIHVDVGNNGKVEINPRVFPYVVHPGQVREYTVNTQTDQFGVQCIELGFACGKTTHFGGTYRCKISRV